MNSSPDAGEGRIPMPIIDRYFDVFDHLINRAKQSLDNLQPFVITTALFLLLIIGVNAVVKRHRSRS
jgi:hypothetical protein